MSDNYIIPEISWVNTSPEAIANAVISRYEAAAGRTLYPGDPVRLELLTIAQQIAQERALLDDAAAQTFLQYARSLYLDVIGESRGVPRLTAAAATCILQFTADPAPAVDIVIPAGIRATKDGDLAFATTEAAVIPAGSTTVSVVAVCEATGEAGNGYITGEIATMVDPIAGVADVGNTNATSGGAEPEDDERYRERVRLSITQYSTAGPRDAYIYHALSASGQISDVSVLSPDPGCVDVYILLAGGVIPAPAADILDTVQDYLDDETRRPLTDLVSVKAPVAGNYDITLTYYIGRSQAAQVDAIRTAVDAAVAAYTAWQRARIGRDINPDELLRLILNAGAKRVVITAPVYTALDATQVAQEGATTVTYGGLEDD